MLTYTDSIDYAQTVLGQSEDLWSVPTSEVPGDLRGLLDNVYGTKDVRESTLCTASRWRHLLLVEVAERSHYDLLIELSRSGLRLPDRVLCLAGAGERFHGFKDRRWIAPPGNIYLSVHLRPNRAIKHPATSFTVLAAISVIDAVDAMPGLQKLAGIKWVNDILIEGAKVGGVLAYTQSAGATVSSAVLGIGVNVETEPDIEPSPFVRRACALKGWAPESDHCNQRRFFAALAAALDANYSQLLAGEYEALLDRYRERSLVIGQKVTLCADKPGQELNVMARGRASGIGDGLELEIEGHARRFVKGRLIIDSLEDIASRKE